MKLTDTNNKSKDKQEANKKKLKKFNELTS